MRDGSFTKNHFAGLHVITRFHAQIIDAGATILSTVITAIPKRLMVARASFTIIDVTQNLASNIVDFESDRGGVFQAIGNVGNWIEGIGINRTQFRDQGYFWRSHIQGGIGYAGRTVEAHTAVQIGVLQPIVVGSILLKIAVGENIALLGGRIRGLD